MLLLTATLVLVLIRRVVFEKFKLFTILTNRRSIAMVQEPGRDITLSTFLMAGEASTGISNNNLTNNKNRKINNKT